MITNLCPSLGGPAPSAPKPKIDDEQIIACIKKGSYPGLPVKGRPNRGLIGLGVKNSLPLAELNRAFPAIPYHKIYYQVNVLARSGRIRRRRVGRSVLLIVPE
jgi:hypothetical protein